MKTSFIKHIGAMLAAVALVATSFSSHAAEASASPTQASYNLLIGTNALQLQSITVANASSAIMTAYIYDSPNTNTTYVRSAYTNTLSYTTNLVTTFTNFSGVIQTNTNTVLYTYTSVAPQATNSYRVLNTFTVPAGESLVWTPSPGIYANFGLSAYASTNGTITVQYNSAR